MEERDRRFSEDKVNVFISYSWDSEEHQQWVMSLAEEITKAGGNPLVDKKDLRFGHNISLFMETMVVRSDVVLMILTPNYKDKADNRTGGVGYEYNIITNKLYTQRKNEKYIPILRLGNKESAVPHFLESYTYANLRDGKGYQSELDVLLHQILGTRLKQPEKQKKKPVEIEYQSTSKLEKEIESRFDEYFNQIFGLQKENITPGGAIIKTDPKRQLKAIQSEIASWKQEIIDYRNALQNAFSGKKMMFFENNPNEFKSKAFRDNLWTVSAAMRTRDPDLARYKKDFANVTSTEVLETVQRIMEKTAEYVVQVGSQLDYSSIQTIDDLSMAFLEEEEMFLNKIIGFGIRSEILHRLHPAHFPVMTQRTLWAMYFLTDNARELIAIEHKSRSGVMRVSHNWQYDYARFTYFNNFLAELMEKKLKGFKVSLDPAIRFGYVNLFLVELAKLHKSDIDLLHQWSEV